MTIRHEKVPVSGDVSFGEGGSSKNMCKKNYDKLEIQVFTKQSVFFLPMTTIDLFCEFFRL